MFLLPVRQDVNVACFEELAPFIFFECSGQPVEVLSTPFSNKVYHKGSHSDVEHMHSLIRASLVAPED